MKVVRVVCLFVCFNTRTPAARRANEMVMVSLCAAVAVANDDVNIRNKVRHVVVVRVLVDLVAGELAFLLGNTSKHT
jgi:hypothetical protein